MKTIRTTIIAIVALGLLAGTAVGVAAQNALVTGGGESIDDCGDDFSTGATCRERWQFDDPRLSGESESTLTSVIGAEGGKDPHRSKRKPLSTNLQSKNQILF